MRSKLIQKSWIRVKVSIHLFLGGSCVGSIKFCPPKSVVDGDANYEETKRLESSYFVIVDHMKEFQRLRFGWWISFPADW